MSSTTSAASRPARSNGNRAIGAGPRLAFVLLAGICLIAAAAPRPAGADAGLRLLRAERRAAVRAVASAADSTGRAAPFGLLVIPVDFADARLPQGWEPGPSIGGRLFPTDDPASLAAYFDIASGGRTRLEILLAPVVHLPGTRRDYSDIDLNLYTRTRRLASESIGAVAATGVDFRLLDLDGPDGLPGSGDDDGEVDGVLILHGAPGLENDPQDGLVVPLAFYLDEPVFQRGVAAGSYAVASLQSGLGIWAHETGHLLGLEDRYDPFLPAAGAEMSSRGGLGVFSLMSAGAWGAGDAAAPALPDAYSCAEVGWLDVMDWPGSAAAVEVAPSPSSRLAWRVGKPGSDGREYFLFEVRDGAGPYDPLLPGPRMLVYHVDEAVPEGTASQFAAAGSHLRVRLVEADGDDSVAEGENTGRIDDLFPGDGQAGSWTSSTIPSTYGYGGPTGIEFESIAVGGSGIELTGGLPSTAAFSVSLGFTDAAEPLLDLAAVELGAEPYLLVARVAPLSTVHGDFSSGSPVDVPLIRGYEGRWIPVVPPVWSPAPDLPAGAATDFAVTLIGDGEELQSGVCKWIWNDPTDPLDPETTWPQDWEILQDGEPGTLWHLWPAADGPELVCTAAAATGPGVVADPVYANRTDITLRSPAFASDGGVLLLVHRVRVAIEDGGVGPDGAVVEIEDQGGLVLPLAPRGGYPAQVDAKSLGALHGRGAFIDGVEGEAAPWRVDLFDLPADGRPVRIRLRLASDPAWRDFGWRIARMEVLTAAEAVAGFTAGLLPDQLESGALCWNWPWADPEAFAVDFSADGGLSWAGIWTGEADAGGGWEHCLPLGVLPRSGSISSRGLLRVRAPFGESGDAAARPVVWHLDGGAAVAPAMGAPWPNPAGGEVRVLLDIPPEATGGKLSIYDLRGRLVRRWSLGSGNLLHVWDGTDTSNRRQPAGSYLLRLESSAGVFTRKVVLLR